ncbi:hypothetical protein [Nocardia sp. NPDC057668]|uniref:hypothetical protein n=1 Tax=Nocardia sp. NPDC057668 TaxID=3346202 RepID=UPI00367077DA
MRIASAFHGIDSQGGPKSSPDRVHVTDPAERAAVANFLAGGAFVMGTSRRGADLLDPARGDVVPTIDRTDGVWIWPHAIHYYLVEHAVPLEADFLHHIRECGYVATKPTPHHVRAAIRAVNEEAFQHLGPDPEIVIVRLQDSDLDEVAVFAVDERRCADRRDYRKQVLDVSDWVGASDFHATYEMRQVAPDEDVRLPSWETYRAGLRSSPDGDLDSPPSR